ncbi:protein adenylyltransferase SelO family protein [Candidatus Igneacidithiobacillus taiwanensis]|uniref:protein adenylyltransferase SelO n=1 Tax=Candidatus Igneacidithiobacillus taiwanensis TaxID=1945924 RepID=UPI0028963647|nr:YdiU family protein [Candidatus Igneacidithiobacillus taiwanensis]
MERELRLEADFAAELEGLYAPWQAAPIPNPQLCLLNEGLAIELGLPLAPLRTEAAALLSGQRPIPGSRPLAQAYAGHQFGVFNPQLGDGRALLLGEWRDPQGRLWDLHLKGSGRTPFSRGGDGKAALGPMLREYVLGEAMHALGIPSTRALAVLRTGEAVQRERPLPGAILARVAASHLRVGTFQYVAIREDEALLRRLCDYAIARHYPELQAEAGGTRYLAFLTAVMERQARLIAQWMGVGFIHGVMNTDNMSIAGETIDYGPCAFLDAYDPATVFSSIDQNGRYAYGEQPRIGQWNLVRLAECLVPLVDADVDHAIAQLTDVLQRFPARYQQAWREIFAAKLGILAVRETDDALLEDFLQLLADEHQDFTLAFRSLAADLQAMPVAERQRLGIPASPASWQPWRERWLQRLGTDRPQSAIGAAMDRVNPIYIPRNHQVEIALAAASEADDWRPLHKLLEVLANPYSARPEYLPYSEPMPGGFGPYRTFCGT